jgi:3-methyladenine DNA glycosylase AlkD
VPVASGWSAPVRVARETHRSLAGRANPRKALEVQRYFKDTVCALGITLPEVRAAAADVYREIRRTWSVDDAVVFCDRLIRDPHLEIKSVGIALLERYSRGLRPDHLPLLRRWLERHCGNWATVDHLAPHVLGDLIDRHPDVVPDIVDWTAHPVIWVRRAAAVGFILHARRGRRLGAVYRIARRLLGDDEDLIHKATGWLLREAGKTDAKRLKAFLLAHGSRVPRTTLRYAIERFPERDRLRILRATRGP